MPQIEVRAAPGGGRALRPHARATCAAPSPRCVQGHEGRRGLRGAEGLRRGRLGRAGSCARDLDSPARPAASTPPAGGQVPLGDVADVRIAPDAQRDQARGRVAPDRRDLQRARPRPRAASPARSRRAWAGSPSTAGYHPEFLGEYAARAAAQPPAALLLGACRCSASCSCCYADFRSLRLTAARCSSPCPSRSIGGVAGGLPRRRRALARLAGRLRHRARHRRAQRHHAGQPLPPPGGGGGRCRSAPTWCCAAPRSGWRRS